ncbi:MAG: acyltransferase [Betaproteobacteria bacterium RIFCSPLOWO2_12_FULL_62_58]|nr:MAG: acyltransferase [Betaproteobacteria bacterium RIFCSPLOWO2_12_FULL_62_58]
MKSSSGAHFIALDHVRALAVFMVFAWHFTHAENGYPVPFEFVPIIPFSLLAEGHTGVALFMTLSGYLFAKLLDGKTIDYKAFLWNRALRLLPLLAVVLSFVGVLLFIKLGRVDFYIRSIARGIVLPVLPNGGWSITAEFHFYVILPLLLWMMRKSRLLPLSVIAAAVLLRFFIHSEWGEVQSFAYLTLIGRIDQFVLGMVTYQCRSYIARRHLVAITVLLAFAVFYWQFDLNGGLNQNPSYPSPSSIWIFLPAIEGLAYAVGIAWYDSSFSPSNKGDSWFIGKIGEYSYSIYLLHFFFVFRAARFVHENVMDMSNFYVACLWSLTCFLAIMVPVGYLSYRFIESPFLKLRKPYILQPIANLAWAQK